METESKKCPTCGKGHQLNKEFFPDLTITYYGCGHQNIAVVVNETSGITEKIERDIQEDYAELGNVYLEGPLFAKTFDPIKKGKLRFEEIREELFKFLCVEKQLCEKIKKMENIETLTLLRTLGGFLIGSSVISSLIPVGVISTIIIKIGIKKFCMCE